MMTILRVSNEIKINFRFDISEIFIAENGNLPNLSQPLWSKIKVTTEAKGCQENIISRRSCKT